MAALQGVALAPLLFGLDDGPVRPLAEALAVVAGEPVGHDLGVCRDLAVGEGFQRAFGRQFSYRSGADLLRLVRVGMCEQRTCRS